MSWDRAHEMQYERRGVPWIIRIGIAALIAIIVAVILSLIFIERVDATESCAITQGGRKLVDADGKAILAGPGYHFMGPTTSLVCYTVVRQTVDVVSGDPAQSNSTANIKDWAIRTRTSDGIDLYAMLTMQYHLEPDCVGTLYPRVVNDAGVASQVVIPRLRSRVPQVLNRYGAVELYQGNLGGISDIIAKELSQELEAECVRVDLFELKRGDFDDRFEEGIRQQGEQRMATQKKTLEQETAKAEAERLRIATAGENAASLAKEQNARAIAAQRTDAVVYDLTQRAAALQANPSLIEWERVQALRDAGAIYLPSGVLPILNVPTPTPEGA